MDLREIVEYLVNVDDEQWYRYLFASETLNDRISEDKRVGLTAKAKRCGENILSTFSADRLQEEFNNLHITENGNIGGGDMQYSFATFQGPNKVTLNSYIIQKTDGLVETYQLQDLLGISARDVLLRHEFFHYLEDRYPDVCLCDEKICLWKVLGHKHEMTVNCLSEIAGNAFVKESLELNYNPQLFDVVFSYALSEDRGAKVFNYLLHLLKDDEMIARLNYKAPPRRLTLFDGKRLIFKHRQKTGAPAGRSEKGG